MRWLTLVLIALPSVAIGHPAPFSYLDFRITNGSVEGAVTVHDFDVAHDVGVNPPELLRDRAVAEKYRDQLMRLIGSRLTVMVDGQRAELLWRDFETLPERQSLRLSFRIDQGGAASLRVSAVLFPYDPVHQTFINIYEDGALRQQTIVDASRPTAHYYSGSWQGAAAVWAVFTPAGIEHILAGPDHVLFLVGLLLLGGTLWQLTAIVTAFTIGHSITLSLAALDVVSPPANVIEPVIALSIVLVGADNLLVDRERRARLERPASESRDIRAWLAGVFGLVHGFGFASVLKEFGLPAAALGWSLFSFNVGVEIGQVAIVVAISLALGALARRHPQASRHLVIAGSVIVVAAGAYWFVERVFLTGGME